MLNLDQRIVSNTRFFPFSDESASTFTRSSFQLMQHLTTILITLLFLTSASWMTANAQWGGPQSDPQEIAEVQTQMMVDSLGLSDAQRTKVASVNGTYAQKLQEVRDNADGDFKTTRQQMQAVIQAQDQELQKYLTTDQWTSWQDIRLRMRKQRGPHTRRRD